MDEIMPSIAVGIMLLAWGFFILMLVNRGKKAIRARRRNRPPALPSGLGLSPDSSILEYTQAELRNMREDKEADRREERRQAEVARTERDAEQRRVGNIIASGTMDVLNAWYYWATDAETLEAENQTRMRSEIEAKIALGTDQGSAEAGVWHEDTQRRKHYVENIDALTGDVLDDTWTVSQLQIRGYQILEAVALAGEKLGHAHDYLCRISALIADQREDVFDVEKAPVTARYAYSEDPDVRALYLQGRSVAVEQIIDAHTEARQYLDRIRAAQEAVKAANQQQSSYIRGIRETNPHTASRDQEIEWQRQLDAIEGNTTP